MSQQDNSVFKPLLIAFSLILLGFISGTLGYYFIEGYNLLDAFYMTIITISTVGFSELKPLSPLGKLFTSLFIIFNLGTFTLFVSMFSRYIVEGEFNKLFVDYRNINRMKKLQNHIIVCGYGRYGKRAVEELEDSGEDFVVIESDKKSLKALDITVEQKNKILVGDANDDKLLKEAGIERAKALIAALPDDASNVFVTLSARELNPDISIIARASQESTRKKLETAGANHVILPDMIGGHFMASLVTRPQVMGFLSRIAGWSQEKLILEEFKSRDLKEEYLNKTLGELNLQKKYDVTVVGYKNDEGEYRFNPKAKLELTEGGVIIVLGEPQSIENFKVNTCKS